MADVTNEKSLWVKSFKRLLTNLFKELEQLKSTLSKDTKCASFKLEPQGAYLEESFLECRFEVFPKDSEMEVQDKDAARIVLGFAKDYKPLIAGICEFWRSKLPAEVAVRSNANGSRIYLTRSNLPALDLNVHVSQQIENIKKYGDACNHLQRLWKSNCADFDAYMKTAKA